MSEQTKPKLFAKSIIRCSKHTLKLWRRIFADHHTPDEVTHESIRELDSTLGDDDPDLAEDDDLSLRRFGERAPTNDDIDAETASAILFWRAHNLEGPFTTETDRSLAEVCPGCGNAFGRETLIRCLCVSRVLNVATTLRSAISGRETHMETCPHCQGDVAPAIGGCLVSCWGGGVYL